MLEAARKVGAGALRLPPRFDADGGKLARGPGESSFVRPSWPTQFPPTPADVKMLVETAVAGTVGKQVLSQKTAIKMLAANGAIPVENAEEEIDRIEADGQKSADQMATASGLVTEATVAATPTPADDEEDVTT